MRSGGARGHDGWRASGSLLGHEQARRRQQILRECRRPASTVQALASELFSLAGSASGRARGVSSSVVTTPSYRRRWTVQREQSAVRS